MDILERVETKGSFSNLLLNEAIRKEKIEPSEINLLTELVYGVMQNKYALDYQLGPFLNKPQKLENWVRQLLRLSLYQLLYLDRIPEHAVVNEAVLIAKKRGHKGISGLINGVLRNVIRKGTPPFEDIVDSIERIGIQYSLPKWMVQKFVNELGLEETEKLASSFLERSKVSLRVNTKQISKKDAIEHLVKEGYDVTESEISSIGLISESGLPAKSDLFQSGAITIQDESSMLVAPALEIMPHHKVLDACAAPGGKTTHIASFLDKEVGGQVIALDLHQKKVKLIEDNARRQGVSQVVKANAMDAREAETAFGRETFDRILVDAPCSGLGLMRRKPDIRYTKTLEDVKNLKIIQKEILDKVSKTLRTDGQLVYSTCTLTRDENKEVVDQFLEDNPNFERTPVFLEKDEVRRSSDGSVTIYPQEYGTDGFFICALKKKK